jgi:predicted nuclease with TOPRIM domain
MDLSMKNKMSYFKRRAENLKETQDLLYEEFAKLDEDFKDLDQQEDVYQDRLNSFKKRTRHLKEARKLLDKEVDKYQAAELHRVCDKIIYSTKVVCPNPRAPYRDIGEPI